MGCNHISGTIYLGYVLDAMKFRPMPPINSRIYEFQSDDWDELTGKMTKSWNKFSKKRIAGNLHKEFKGLKFHHIHEVRVSNYESEPSDEDGCIIFGYQGPSISRVSDKTFEQFNLLNSYKFPLECGKLLKDFSKEFITSNGGEINPEEEESIEPYCRLSVGV